MVEQMQWLQDVKDGRWARLAAALTAGLPVPTGFVVAPACPETDVRAAYEKLKILEHTHFVAVRGPAHAVIEVIGNDRVIHTLRAVSSESAEAEILVQTMVNSSWCGKAIWEGNDLRIQASAGLRCLDPDTYVVNTTTLQCAPIELHESPRKVFRAVDGSTRTMQIQRNRPYLEPSAMESIAILARRADSNITWALDDRKVWLISAAGPQ